MQMINQLFEDGHLNAKIVAQPPSFIAKEAGFNIPEGTQFFIVPETGVGPDYPFSGEKLSVTMALFRAKVFTHYTTFLRSHNLLSLISSFGILHHHPSLRTLMRRSR